MAGREDLGDGGDGSDEWLEARTPDDTVTRRPGLGLPQTLVVTAYLFLVFALWAVSSPLMGVPDEPAHTVKAASVWHGQLRGDVEEMEGEAGMSGSGRITVDVVRVPESYASAHAVPGCYAFRPDVPASCAPDLEDSGRMVTTHTTAGPYPPLFYLLVGWPSRLVQNDAGAYMMRMVAALLGAASIAFALRSLSRVVPVPLGVVAVTVAITPMVPFLVGSINPAGFEIAGAMLWWAASMALALSWSSERELDRGLVAELLVGFAVLTNTRSLGLLFAGLALGVVAAFVGLERCRVVVRDRRSWVLAGVMAVIAGASVAWVVASGHLGSVPGAPLPPGSRPLVVLGGAMDDFLRQLVAVFGWKDTTVTSSIATWMVAALMLLGAVVLAGTAWRRAVVLGGAVAVVLLPVFLQLSTVERDGLAWQGRYLLPFAVGVPMMAAVAIAPAASELRSGTRALAVVVTAMCGFAVAVGQFAWLHRSTIGVAVDSLNPMSWDGWAPPVHPAVLVGSTVLLACVPVAAVAIGLRAGGEDLESGSDEREVDATLRAVTGDVGRRPGWRGSPRGR
jgi:hypothetical protein